MYERAYTRERDWAIVGQSKNWHLLDEILFKRSLCRARIIWQSHNTHSRAEQKINSWFKDYWLTAAAAATINKFTSARSESGGPEISITAAVGLAPLLRAKVAISNHRSVRNWSSPYVLPDNSTLLIFSLGTFIKLETALLDATAGDCIPPAQFKRKFFVIIDVFAAFT